MKICGIIAEYDPYHNGHRYLTERLRERGYTHIAAVMSGSFVQRGEAAALSKWARTECALNGGVDLVLELPLPWALSPAEKFARGGVGVLHSLGCIDALAFGCESGDSGEIVRTAHIMQGAAFGAALREATDSGKSFPAATAAAAEKCGIDAALLSQPNNVLAVEYAAAAEKQRAGMDIIAVRREQSLHDEMYDVPPAGDIASASYLRSLMREGGRYAEFMPDECAAVVERELAAGRAPADTHNCERALLAVLRCMSAEDAAALPEVSEGLENRIYGAVRRGVTYDGIIMDIKTKRYTHARIRRILLSAFVGLSKDSGEGVPPYIRVLGHNRRGRDILRAARDSARLPIIMKAGDVRGLTESCRALFSLESRADDLWGLCTPQAEICGSNMTHGAVITEKE